MQTKWLRRAAIMVAIALPIVIGWFYRESTRMPQSISIASGPAGGRYRQISESLAHEIRRELGIEVKLVDSTGSLDNIRLLQSGQVDFALYQPGTQTHSSKRGTSGETEPAFVANLYLEVLHLIVRQGVVIETADDLRGKRVNVGVKTSGDYASSRVLIEHLDLDESLFDAQYLDYVGVEQAMSEGTLDVAIITAGTEAPILRSLFKSGECRLLSVPFARALSAKRVSMSSHQIPAGLYRSHSPAVPMVAIDTIALRAQLLTRRNTHYGLVENVTQILLSEQFLKRNELRELFAGGRDFAREKPEFAMHSGAAHFYDPDLRPLLNTDFVEATEGIRSFVVSVLIAGFLVIRYLRQQRINAKEHRLDRYIRSLLKIERRQMNLDQGIGCGDIGALQQLLDELTSLRQEALAELSAHELSEDRAADCFVQMCHALSDKINFKLSRQRLDKQIEKLGPGSLE